VTPDQIAEIEADVDLAAAASREASRIIDGQIAELLMADVTDVPVPSS
jgi:hypothetical protein